MTKTTAEHDPKAAERLRNLIRDIRVAMITTVTPDGALRSRPMYTRDADEDGALWFVLQDDSEQAHDLAEEQAVNVSYADPAKNRYVSVTGNASIARDPHRLADLWTPDLERFFPHGADDPHLAVMKVRIESAEFWDVNAGRMVPVHELPGTNRAAGAKPAGEHTRVDIRATPTSG